VKVAKSLYRLTMASPKFHLISVFDFVSGNITKMMVDLWGFYGSDFCVRLDNDLTLGTLIYAVAAAVYLDLRRRGCDISALRYENLVAQPVDMCRVVLEFCHLPVSLAELVVKAFDVDSQRNFFIAKSAIGHFKEPQTDIKLNETLKKFGLPLIG